MALSMEVEPLKLFNEKAEKLLNTRFVKYIQETKRLSVTISAKRGQEVTIEKKTPDQEAIDAFVLTFRFFIQKREKSSFRNLGKVYEKLPISSKIKKDFADWRKALNDYLNQKVGITINGLSPTKRDLQNIFIYGCLAHADSKKKLVYDKWKVSAFYPVLETHFCGVLEVVLRAIMNVAEINKKAIEELEK